MGVWSCLSPRRSYHSGYGSVLRPYRPEVSSDTTDVRVTKDPSPLQMDVRTRTTPICHFLSHHSSFPPHSGSSSLHPFSRREGVKTGGTTFWNPGLSELMGCLGSGGRCPNQDRWTYSHIGGTPSTSSVGSRVRGIWTTRTGPGRVVRTSGVFGRQPPTLGPSGVGFSYPQHSSRPHRTRGGERVLRSVGLVLWRSPRSNVSPLKHLRDRPYTSETRRSRHTEIHPDGETQSTHTHRPQSDREATYTRTRRRVGGDTHTDGEAHRGRDSYRGDTE